MRDHIIIAATFLATVAASALAVGPQPHHAAAARLKASGGGYTAYATDFAGDGQAWVELDAEGTVSDGKTGTVSFWLDPTGTDTTDWRLWGTSNGRIRFNRGGGADIFYFTLCDSTGATVVELRQNSGVVGSITAADGWCWVAACWDNATSGECYVYISKSAGGATDCTTIANDTGGNEDIDWTNTDWGLGAAIGGTQPYEGELCEFYFSSTYYDLSSSTNRDLFYDSTNHKPAGDLTSVGSPEFYFQDPYDSFTTNSGSAGSPFTKKGTTALAEGTAP